jgi:hypothetical protein
MNQSGVLGVFPGEPAMFRRQATDETKPGRHETVFGPREDARKPALGT